MLDAYFENLSLLQKHIPEIGKSLSLPKLAKERLNVLHKSKFPKIDSHIFLLCLYKVEKIEEKLLSWLKDDEKRKIVFLEEDLLSWQRFLENPLARDLLTQQRISFFHYDENTFKKICWNHLFIESAFITLSDPKAEAFIQKREKFFQTKLQVESSFSWYSDFAKEAMENFYGNIVKSQDLFSYAKLKNCAQNIPALICGAGPSLVEQKNTLQKFQDKALIFAGGTSMNILSKEQIFYHFEASLEKASLYHRTKEISVWQKPYFFSPFVNPEHRELSQGPFIYVNDQSTLPLQEWIEKSLSIPGEDLDKGWHVACFLISLATYMGCNPIILTGVDLCYQKNKYGSYCCAEEQQSLLQAKNVYQEDVYTQKDWLVGAFWMEEFIQEHPEVQFINASQGLDISGVKNISFQEIEKSFFAKEQRDTENFTHALMIQLEKIMLNQQRVKELFQSMQEEMKDCESLIQKTFQKWEAQQSFASTDEEKALEKKNLYHLLLNPLWRIWQPLWEQKTLQEEHFLTKDEQQKMQKMVFLLKILECHRQSLEKYLV